MKIKLLLISMFFGSFINAQNIDFNSSSLSSLNLNIDKGDTVKFNDVDGDIENQHSIFIEDSSGNTLDSGIVGNTLTTYSFTIDDVYTVNCVTHNTSATITSKSLNNPDFITTNYILYPNPTKDIVNINAKIKIAKVEIYSILGSRLLTKDFDSKTIKLSTSNLISGIYLNVITFSDNTKKSIKLIKMD